MKDTMGKDVLLLEMYCLSECEAYNVMGDSTTLPWQDFVPGTPYRVLDESGTVMVVGQHWRTKTEVQEWYDDGGVAGAKADEEHVVQEWKEGRWA